MTTTQDVELLDLREGTVGLYRDGSSDFGNGPGPLRRISGLVVGVWQRVLIHEPSQLVHRTPGPGGEHRPLGASASQGVR